MADTEAWLPARSTPALVQLLAQASAARVSEALAARGLTEIRPGHSLLLVPLLGGAWHASELAAHLGVSRQAVAQLVATLERGGYVGRVADPGDARAKLICLTARGRLALRVMRSSAQLLEREWEERLGPDGLAQLRVTLGTLLGGAG